MKIFRLIGMLLIGSSTLFSCSNNEDELPPKEQTNQETYTISFNLGGEFISTSETPLSRTEVAPKKIYGINVYYKKDGNTWYDNYAYGLFDNIQDMTISLISGYRYKFECTMIQNDNDIIYHDKNGYYGRPFMSGDNYNGDYNANTVTQLTNKFHVSTTTYRYLDYIKYGTTDVCTESSFVRSNYPKTDRFYGELTDYIPTKDGVANIDLKRTAFGLKFIVTPPVDGKLYISSITTNDNSYHSINSNVEVSADDNILESSSMYTFYEVYECWQAENYTKDFTIRLKWKRANGATQTFEEVITVKRNVMTTVNVNVNGGTTDSSLGVKEDDTPMGNENVDMNFNGGDLDDNEVNPNI